MTTTMNTAQGVVAEKKEWWAKRRETVVTVGRYLDISQSDLARALGLSRQSMSDRLSGATKLEPWEIAGIALVFGVPEYVLWYEPPQAVRWILDNPDQVNPPKGPGGGPRTYSRWTGLALEPGVFSGATRLHVVEAKLLPFRPYTPHDRGRITVPTGELRAA